MALILLLGAAIAIAMQNPVDLTEVGRHPDPRYLVRPAGVPIFSLGRASEVSGRLREGSDRLREKDHGIDVGVIEGPEEFVFGQISGTALGPEGMLYVLDSRFNDLRVFDLQGHHVQTFGRSGEGPGEFHYPTVLAVSDLDDELYVADATRRLQRFSIAGRELKFIDLMTLDLDALSICFIGRQMIIHGMSDGEAGRLITVRDPESGPGLQFGDSYSSPNPLLNRALSGGTIACDLARQLIYYAPRGGLSEVWAYSLSGQPRWIVALTDFLPIDTIEYDDGRYGMFFPDGGHDEVASLVLLPGGQLLVQVNRIVSPGPGLAAITGTDSYLIDPDSGSGGYIGDDLPLIATVRDRYVITLSDFDYPMLTIRSTP